MVYYFTSNVVEPSAFIYVGKDKVESMQPVRQRLCRKDTDLLDTDEELIKYGLEEDVW
jgi:hypothetical protein